MVQLIDLTHVNVWHRVSLTVEHRELTLMFTDIVGYSRLMGQDEAQTIALLGEYRRILLARIREFEGTVIEFIGDAVFARFDQPKFAVDAGVAIQQDLAEFNRQRDAGLPALRTRIGIHMGEVAIKDGALFGDDVNIAARLEPIAIADGLCLSERVYQAVRADLKQPVLGLGVQTLKNIDGRVRAYLVRPAGITLRTRLHYWNRRFNQKVGTYRYPIAAAIFLLLAAGVYFVPRWLVPGYTANYVEIADFKNLMSEDGEADYFSSGITAALRSQLADLRNVYILTAGEGVRGPLRLEGSVQRMDDRLRIAYRLLRRKDNVQIAGGKLDGAYRDIFILQDRVVAEIAGYLAEEFGLAKFRPPAPKLTSDITAYDYYLRGIEYLNLPKSHENFDAAIKMLSTALVHDSKFAKANAGLCNAYRRKYLLTRKADWAERAVDYCNLALSQDDSLKEVYEALGSIYRDTGQMDKALDVLDKALAIDSPNVTAMVGMAKVYEKQNNTGLAEKSFLQAIDIRPDYWRAYQEYAVYLTRQGRLEEAIHNYMKVLEITPENSIAYSNLGGAYLFLGDYKKAASALFDSVKISPSSWGYSNTGAMYYFAGEFSRSAAMFREAIRLAPQDFRWHFNLGDSLRQIKGQEDAAQAAYEKTIQLALPGLEVNENDLEVVQYLVMSHYYTGDMDKAQHYLNELVALGPKNLNVIYTQLKYWSAKKDMEKAFDALSQLLAAGYSQSLLEADPDLEVLRESHRYKEVLLSANAL